MQKPAYSAQFMRWFGRPQSRSSILLGAVLALGVAGCGKGGKAEGPGPSVSNQVSPNAVAPAPAPAPDLAEITRNLRRWIVRNQRPPRDFEDFAASANVTIPPPPAGKKYVIDKTMHVILVNR